VLLDFNVKLYNQFKMKKIIVLLSLVSFVFLLALSVVQVSNASNSDSTEMLFPQDQDAVSAERLAAGKAIYEGKGTCSVCHQLTGTGLPPTFPPLAKADYLLADKKRAIRQTMYGAKEPITVNGVTYPGGLMTVVPLTDQEVVDVVNYILNSWGNNGGIVTLEEVKAERK
jgi:nitrite reductase (NO-forming)